MPGSDVDFVLVEQRRVLRDVFPLLDEGCEAVAAHCPELGVIGADVFTAAVNGDVLIHLARVAGEIVGFMVTHPVSGIGGSRDLHVWLLYLVPGTPDVMAEVVAELDLLAREQGCGGVSFNTTRRAWQRRLAPYGYAPRSLAFHKSLEGV